MDENLIIQKNIELNNNMYVLREDLLPYSFGGNKVRKAIKFFDFIRKSSYDTVITYGSPSSNHARVIANMATMHDLRCIIITPKSNDFDTFNSVLVTYLGATMIYCSLQTVRETIEQTIEFEKQKGKKPYFIEGGGHGNLGTEAYVDAFQQILDYEKESNIVFDYIFVASGTGTTLAGLIIGDLINNSMKKIIGISIARTKERGSEVINESMKDYINEKNLNIKVLDDNLIFDDSYIVDGYGTYNKNIEDVIEEQFNKNGLPLDPTYTGKAFWGMEEYIIKNKIRNKNILFIHTGGTPLFFDYFNEKGKSK